MKRIFQRENIHQIQHYVVELFDAIRYVGVKAAIQNAAVLVVVITGAVEEFAGGKQNRVSANVLGSREKGSP